MDQSARILELEKQVAALTEANQKASSALVAELEAKLAKAEADNAEFAQFFDDSADLNATVTVGTEGFKSLLTERWQLRKRVQALLEEATAKHDSSLYRVVRRFHQKFGHPVEHTPQVPSDDQVRFRLKLIAEEFLELLDAALRPAHPRWLELVAMLKELIETAPVQVNLSEFYDAQIDLAWVIEGTHAVMGTRAEPGIAEVARANMAKDPVYVAHKDAYLGGNEPTDRDARLFGTPDPKAKPKKPEGWTPPDVKGVLRAQGWVEDEV